MIQFPDKVKVGGHEYKVCYPYRFQERCDLGGQVDHASLDIRIESLDTCGNLKSESKIMGTFIHEVIHCIDVTWNTKLSEDQVIGLEEGILAVLKDNGWLK